MLLNSSLRQLECQCRRCARFEQFSVQPPRPPENSGSVPLGMSLCGARRWRIWSQAPDPGDLGKPPREACVLCKTLYPLYVRSGSRSVQNENETSSKYSYYSHYINVVTCYDLSVCVGPWHGCRGVWCGECGWNFRPITPEEHEVQEHVVRAAAGAGKRRRSRHSQE